MDTWQRRMLVGAHAAILTMAATAGARTHDADKGEVDFLLNCSGCHGTDGKGSGPLSAKLDSKRTDLTLLAKHNHGTFDAGAIIKRSTAGTSAQATIMPRCRYGGAGTKVLHLPRSRPPQNLIRKYQKDFCRR